MRLPKLSNLVALAVFVVVVLGCASFQVAGADRFAIPPSSTSALGLVVDCPQDGGSAAYARVFNLNGEITHITLYRKYLGKFYLVAVMRRVKGEFVDVLFIEINTGKRTVLTWAEFKELDPDTCAAGMPPGKSA